MGCVPSSLGSNSGNSVNLSTQGAFIQCGSDRLEPETRGGVGSNHVNKATNDENLLTLYKEGDNSNSGYMKMKLSKMSILLVFGKEDAQSDAFIWAADRAGYRHFLVKSSECAVQLYLEHQHDLVIIDCRHSKSFDHEALCRSMKAMFPKSCTRFLAVTKKYSDKDEPSILPLLKAGFSRRFVECTNKGSCYNELISIEKSEFRVQQQLQLNNALISTLQNMTESVEIIDAQFQTEFVNNSYERQMGYTADDVLGTEMQEKLQVDNCNEEETLLYHLKKSKVWEGQQTVRRRNGETVLCKCKLLPIDSSQGKTSKHVIIRTPLTSYIQLEGQLIPQWDRPKDGESRPVHAGLMHIRKRESVTRYHSMTIEAPINKVINLLYDAQVNPSVNVIQAIDKVLEILQTTELYVPQVHQVKEEDPLATDYVEGLCDVNFSSGLKHNALSRLNIQNKLGSSLKLQFPHQALAPETEILLENDHLWTFDILKLEGLTNKNVLVPLGMKIFERFNVAEFLEVDDSVLANWLRLIGSNYHSQNSYHNATHAADVLQATAFFLDKLRPKKIMDTSDEVAALIAAVIHDVDHPARTSSFLVNSRDKLALLYNDTAVLENHHAAMGFMLTTKDDKVNILKNLSREEYEVMRHKVIDMVLATEMAKHFEHLQKFMNIFKSYMKPLEDEISQKSGMTAMSDSMITAPENRRQILRMVIKCADVSNPARELNLCIEWANRIAEEYFQQTDDERARKLPVVMPNFDRATCSIPHSQIKFIEVFLLNMFEPWDSFIDIPEVSTMLQNNYKYWKDLDDKQKANDVR